MKLKYSQITDKHEQNDDTKNKLCHKISPISNNQLKIETLQTQKFKRSSKNKMNLKNS